MLQSQSRPYLWVFFIVDKYVLFDPIQIHLFGFLRVMFQANGFADSFEKFFRFWFHCY
jgi:hypothetical protein